MTTIKKTYHFNTHSVTLMDVDLCLHHNWEECLQTKITLPAPAPVICHCTYEGQLSKTEIHLECGDSTANELITGCQMVNNIQKPTVVQPVV